MDMAARAASIRGKRIGGIAGEGSEGDHRSSAAVCRDLRDLLEEFEGRDGTGHYSWSQGPLVHLTHGF